MNLNLDNEVDLPTEFVQQGIRFERKKKRKHWASGVGSVDAEEGALSTLDAIAIDNALALTMRLDEIRKEINAIGMHMAHDFATFVDSLAYQQTTIDRISREHEALVDSIAYLMQLD